MTCNEDGSLPVCRKLSGCRNDHNVAPELDLPYPKAAVKRALRLFLLLGALIGLFGQAVAYASVQPAVSAPMAMSGMAETGMSEDCMKMMAQQQPQQKPCKGMTLACIAAMGCVVPMVVRNDSPALASRETAQNLAFWPTTTVLRGSDLTPEPEPPTLLG
ncbi:hypothetical protein [Sphingobium sp. Ant17]|uniref:hypothetical protein n=1 Tax=Sphingobium sp. Ant17 TaxID=1461752 RepID=UPI001F2FF90E|nr:hypothetical protein [Sphingobium sp. Ant17]